MLDKLKQLAHLKKMQDELKDQLVEVEQQGVKVVLNGRFEVEEILLNPNLQKEEQEIVIRQCFNEAVKKLQMSLAQKFSGII